MSVETQKENSVQCFLILGVPVLVPVRASPVPSVESSVVRAAGVNSSFPSRVFVLTRRGDDDGEEHHGGEERPGAAWARSS